MQRGSCGQSRCWAAELTLSAAGRVALYYSVTTNRRASRHESRSGSHGCRRRAIRLSPGGPGPRPGPGGTQDLAAVTGPRVAQFFMSLLSVRVRVRVSHLPVTVMPVVDRDGAAAVMATVTVPVTATSSTLTLRLPA
jgi:hypothetical protein